MKFKKDDIVFVADNRKSYVGYYNFFATNNLDIHIAARYAYFEQPKNHELYRVLYVDFMQNVCIEEINTEKRIFIIHKSGIVKVGTLIPNYEKIQNLLYDNSVVIT